MLHNKEKLIGLQTAPCRPLGSFRQDTEYEAQQKLCPIFQMAVTCITFITFTNADCRDKHLVQIYKQTVYFVAIEKQ